MARNKNIYKFKFNGKEYKLFFATSRELPDRHGDCDSPEVDGRKIRVHYKLVGERKLKVLIHEMLHAEDFEISEKVVTRIAREIARALRKLGVVFKDE